MSSKRSFVLCQQVSLEEPGKTQGWNIESRVHESKIPGAGKGRFSLENVPGNKRVVIKRLIPMNDIENLTDLPRDCTITFSNHEDLENFITKAHEEGSHSRDTILNLFEHFIWGLDDSRVCLNVATWTINHADSANADIIRLRFELIDGIEFVVGDTLEEGIKEGHEIVAPYHEFVFPDFYKEFCEANHITDVRSMVLDYA